MTTPLDGHKCFAFGQMGPRLGPNKTLSRPQIYQIIPYLQSKEAPLPQTEDKPVKRRGLQKSHAIVPKTAARAKLYQRALESGVQMLECRIR